MEFLGYFAAIKEGIGMIKAVGDAAKSIKDVTASVEPDSKKLIDAAVETLRQKLLDLGDKYLTLQQLAFEASEQYRSIAEENASLREKLVKLEQFAESRDLFERVTLALNTVAYREKAFSGPADEQPLFCPQCFEAKKKTYLSFHEHAAHTKHLKCTVCGTSVHVARDDGPSVRIARVRRSEGWDDL